MSPRPSDIKSADLDDLVEKLTDAEAIGLTAGVGWWHTFAVPRLNIPAIKVSDGPNGIRGNHFFMGTPAKALPCATALGATWDTELVGKAAAKLLALESKLRAASIILAPTVNIQRSPLGGRSFESYSEDPHLSGHIAASYISNVQAHGIGCCIKHFVANDMENDRWAYSSVVSERALREIYLMPFMIAEKYAKPWAYMTAYNRVNGLHMSENPLFLRDILRGEWGSDALVMSDWWGVYGLSESLNAGVDLEMPGNGKWRNEGNMESGLRSKKITMRTVKERARKVLELVQKSANGAPEVLDGDGEERTLDSEEDVSMMRDLAAQAIVLLKNGGGILPLEPNSKGREIKTIAVIGPNAKAKLVSGGGSASLKASYFITPYQGIVNALEGSNVKVLYSEGTRATQTLPTLEMDVLTADGKPGFDASWYSHKDNAFTLIEPPVKKQVIDEAKMFFADSAPRALTKRWTLKLKAFLIPREEDCEFEFALNVDGRAKLFVDGKLVVDNWGTQTKAEDAVFVSFSEGRGVYKLKKGVKHALLVEFSNVRGELNSATGEISPVGPTLSVMGAPVIDGDVAMQESVVMAKKADAVVLCVGLNSDWESEGHDRTTLALPHRTNELVGKILEANKRTIVVTQSGSAIEMPWKDSAPAIVHSWYLGNATGDAIADVLFGKVNPSGKLSMTFPKRLEDTPSFGHFASQNGVVRYAEDLYVGYKHYQNANVEPLFPFGHGLSYTTFEYANLKISTPMATKVSNDFTLGVSLTVKNTGDVVGSEAVQLYVSLPSTPFGHLHPPSQLRAFTKVKDLKPGQEMVVTMKLDKYAVSYWEESLGKWRAESGHYAVNVGRSSKDICLVGKFEVKQVFEWSGL